MFVFAVVGATCAVVQWLLLGVLVHAGVHHELGYVVSFAASAQLNFLLSRRFTWGDRAVGTRRLRPWLAYNLAAAISLGVSSVAFALLVGVTGHWWSADALALASGMAVSFVSGDRVVFHPRLQGRPVPPPGGIPTVPEQRRPEATTVAAREVAAGGVALFLPAYNEAENLPSVVTATVAALSTLVGEHDVIIVDDGSRDDTAAVAGELAATHPSVSVVAHPENLGYGHALRTGFAAGAASGRDWVAFMDADGQFDPVQVGDLLALAGTDRADLVVGFRRRRMDGFARRVNGRLWHWLSRVALRFRVRDVDCGFKLVHRNVLHAVQLTGAYAAVSPELLARASRAGFRIAETPVEHFPRRAGEQTGADLKVVVRSLLGLARLRLSLSGGRQAAGRPYVGGRAGARLVAVAAAVASVVAFVHYHRAGMTLSYDDAVSHMVIARRVLSSPTPGLAQLGSVWLPLPHLLMLPLVWNDTLFYSGIAGTVPSMIAYVATAVLLYRTASLLTGRAAAGLVAALAFAANPNVLYLQSTPMTETLLFAFIAGAVYGLARWIATERWEDLTKTGAALLGATLTRYEGWVMLLSIAAAIAVVAAVRRYDRVRIEASLLYFGLVAGVGVLGWFLWNQVIFGSALDFQNGKFAKPSLWVSNADKAVGHLGTALATYTYAVVDTVGWPLLVVAGAGFVAYLLARPGAAVLAPLAPVALFPFFVYALYSGQRPLHVRPIDPDLYNLRFGLLLVIPAALFAGCAAGVLGRLATARTERADLGRQGGEAGEAGQADGAGGRRWRSWRRALPAAVAFCLVAWVAGAGVAQAAGGHVVTRQEPAAFNRGRAGSVDVAAWLRRHYTGGRILMQGFGNEYVQFAGHVPLSKDVYEGSYRQWDAALADPAAAGIEWVYMTSRGSDQVYQSLHGRPALTGAYSRVYDDGTTEIYRRTR